MTVVDLRSSRRAGDPERGARILDAAERAFAAHGFHAATMQHVAEAAGMSAGNLYRYFPSKEAIVAGLCARDQGQRMAGFAELLASERLIDAFAAGLRQQVAQRTCTKAMMAVEVWAEAARNPEIAKLTRAVDADVMGHLTRLVEAALERGEAAPGVDPATAASVIFTYVGGLFKRIATEPEIDLEREIDTAITVFRAVFAGAMAGPRAKLESKER